MCGVMNIICILSTCIAKRNNPNAQKSKRIDPGLRHHIFAVHNVFVTKNHAFCPKCMKIAENDISDIEFETDSIAYPSFDYLDEYLSSATNAATSINTQNDDTQAKYKPRIPVAPLDINTLSIPEIQICSGFDKPTLEKIKQFANDSFGSKYT
eukprot:142303_1